jgi:hypothetical protein
MRRLGVAMALCGAVFVGLHELGRRWGATRDEVRGPMAGDDIVPRAKGQTTHAMTIDAAVERVWPWLVQMGYHRAGWYTYPWVDRYLWRIDNPSAAQLIPKFQDLSVGDIVPDGEPGTAFYRVAVLDAPHALVLHSTSHVPPPLRGRMTVDWTWAYELRPIGATTTRLALRVRATFRPWWARLIYGGMIVPSDFIMARSMLRGIARRAEGRPSRGDLDDAASRQTGVHDPIASEGRTSKLSSGAGLNQERGNVSEQTGAGQATHGTSDHGP